MYKNIRGTLQITAEKKTRFWLCGRVVVKNSWIAQSTPVLKSSIYTALMFYYFFFWKNVKLESMIRQVFSFVSLLQKTHTHVTIQKAV